MKWTIRALLALTGIALLVTGTFILLIALGVFSFLALTAFSQLMLLSAPLLCALLFIAFLSRSAMVQATGWLKVGLVVCFVLMALGLVVSFFVFQPVLLGLLVGASSATLITLAAVCFFFAVCVLMTVVVSIGIRKFIENRILLSAADHDPEKLALKQWTMVASSDNLIEFFKYTSIDKTPFFQKLINKSDKAIRLHKSVNKNLRLFIQQKKGEIEHTKGLLNDLMNSFHNSISPEKEETKATISQYNKQLASLRAEHNRAIHQFKNNYLLIAQDYITGLIQCIKNNNAQSSESNQVKLTLGQKLILFIKKLLGEWFVFSDVSLLPEKNNFLKP